MALFSFLVRPKPTIPFLGLSLIRNETDTLVTQAQMYVSRTDVQNMQKSNVYFPYRYRFVLKEISIQKTNAVIQCWSMVFLF